MAANFLQAFLDSNPTDADFLEIEKKYGTTAFTQLRTVPKWSDDKATEKAARANVEEAIKRSRAASAKLLRDPARIAKYINNLGATYEERVLPRSSSSAWAIMSSPSWSMPSASRATTIFTRGILSAIKQQEGHAIQGWVAALDGSRPEQQPAWSRLSPTVPTHCSCKPSPSRRSSPSSGRSSSKPRGSKTTPCGKWPKTCSWRMNPGVKLDFQKPEARLVAFARTFYNHTARFAATKTNPDGSPSTVPVWIWDAKAEKLIKQEDVPIGNAEEHYGLRFARWALEKKPDYEPAQGIVLTLAAERAMERAHFGNLAIAEPATFRLLSDAPSTTLNDLLNFGINRKKTALVLAMLQVLGDRADRDAATPPAGTPPRPSLLVKALSYPDPQVQFAAADALLRSPVPVPPEVRGQIVEILRRAAAVDAGAPANAKGTALLADPNKRRSDAVALLLRGMGYDVEVFRTGRDLQRRIARASDFDLIFIDRHTPSPNLIDLISELRTDTRTAARPTFIIASTDKPRLPTFDQLLVRFAAIIAATELQVLDVPPVYVFDARDSIAVNEKNQRLSMQKRDAALRAAVDNRLARLRHVIDAVGLHLTPAQKIIFDLRVELITARVLALDYPITPESSPEVAQRVAQLREQIERQPPTPPYGVGVPTAELIKLIERFETDLLRVPEAQKSDSRRSMRRLIRSDSACRSSDFAIRRSKRNSAAP